MFELSCFFICVKKEFVRSYAAELEVLDREHRQKIKKLEAAYNRQVQEVTEQLKVQQVEYSVCMNEVFIIRCISFFLSCC